MARLKSPRYRKSTEPSNRGHTKTVNADVQIPTPYCGSGEVPTNDDFKLTKTIRGCEACTAAGLFSGMSSPSTGWVPVISTFCDHEYSVDFCRNEHTKHNHFIGSLFLS